MPRLNLFPGTGPSTSPNLTAGLGNLVAAMRPGTGPSTSPDLTAGLGNLVAAMRPDTGPSTSPDLTAGLGNLVAAMRPGTGHLAPCPGLATRLIIRYVPDPTAVRAGIKTAFLPFRVQNGESGSTRKSGTDFLSKTAKRTCVDSKIIMRGRPSARGRAARGSPRSTLDRG